MKFNIDNMEAKHLAEVELSKITQTIAVGKKIVDFSDVILFSHLRNVGQYGSIKPKVLSLKDQPLADLSTPTLY